MLRVNIISQLITQRFSTNSDLDFDIIARNCVAINGEVEIVASVCI